MRKQGKQKQKVRVACDARGSIARLTHPPAIRNVALQASMRLRFISNAAFDNLISYSNLLDCILQASTATQGYQLYDVVRLLEVEVWHCPVGSSVSTVAVEFNGQNTGLVGDNMSHSDSSMGVSPAHVRARPSRTSTAWTWQVTGASSAFRLTVPSGAVIDVSVEFRGEFNEATTVGSALVGATPGATYRRGLDGSPVASTVLVPAVPSAWVR